MARSDKNTEVSNKIKFVINIPVKVESEDQARSTCEGLLKLLESGAYKVTSNNPESEDSDNKKQDTKDIQQPKEEEKEEEEEEEEKEEEEEEEGQEDDESFDDIAVIFGLNGKHTDDLKQMLNNVKEMPSSIRHALITFTWGENGDIATEKKETPYQEIREHLKNHHETRRLVEEMRDKDPESLIYFSFVDSDTVSFNSIYKAYKQIVRKGISESGSPPTVMSTGYEFPKGPYHMASKLDRKVRVITASEFPLGTYYPEPNFCVLVPEGEDTVPESFINPDRKNMESPILISQVKNRTSFTGAVFPGSKPIITEVPPRFGLHYNKLFTNQSHLIPHLWAISAYANGELINRESFPGVVGRNRKYIIDLLKCKDEEFDSMIKTKEIPFIGPGAKELIRAARAVRKILNDVHELS